MSHQLIREDQLSVGAPLPFDAFDSRGVLLMRKGSIVASQAQLERLIESGLYSDDPAPRPREAMPPGAVPVQQIGPGISVIRQLAQARTRAEHLLCNTDVATFVPQVRELAGAIRAAATLDADAALGNIVLSHGTHYPSRHAVNCSAIGSLLLARLEVTEDEIDDCLCALLTMNVSTIDLQVELYQQQAALSNAQKIDTVGHPARSAEQLRARGVTSAVWLDAVLQHHEMLDGSGYPGKLRGDLIGRHARVLAIADQYCAMVSERVFREGVNPGAALRHLLVSQSKGLDPTLCALLARELTPYPPGAAVRLTNGEIAIVCRRTRHPDQPIVRAVKSAQGQCYPEPRKRVTSQAAYHIDKLVAQSEVGRFPAAELLWDDAYERE